MALKLWSPAPAGWFANVECVAAHTRVESHSTQRPVGIPGGFKATIFQAFIE